MRDIHDEVAAIAEITFLASTHQKGAVKVGRLQAVKVSSWAEAISMRSSDDGCNSFTEACEMLTRILSQQFREDYKLWNRCVRAIHGQLSKEIFPKLDATVRSQLGTDRLTSSASLVVEWITWDLVHYLLEQIYSPHVSPAFYTELMLVYENGHFPCLWDEHWPYGKVWYI